MENTQPIKYALKVGGVGKGEYRVEEHELITKKMTLTSPRNGDACLLSRVATTASGYTLAIDVT